MYLYNDDDDGEYYYRKVFKAFCVRCSMAWLGSLLLIVLRDRTGYLL